LGKRASCTATPQAFRVYAEYRAQQTAISLSEGVPQAMAEQVFTAQSHRTDGKFLGFPLKGFGLFTSLLLTLSSGFFAFFLVTTLAIFGLLFWNLFLHHSVNYANSYRYFGIPAAIVIWAMALAVFGTLWLRAKIKAE
jgi:hypothetical protein